ncbi:ATP-binding protein [Anaerobacillus arseniciselenatis]|uniref:ATP-binding protein n=1 Tax=Anaerobacillus arseniciselenatis TaxID=85682 RepID=UPI0009FF3B30|nr:ATP-binding protein [Anaerobacillus arseniciselenatis]
MNKSIVTKILVIIIVTAILGEFKINPFDSSFRFGLGSAGFFFLLLFYKEVPYRITGLVTGIFTTIFRIGLDYIVLDSFSFFASLQTHSPIIGYYFTFALLLGWMMEKKFYEKPLLLVLFGAFCDAFANFVEIIIIFSFSPAYASSSFEKTLFILVVAIIRSIFVVGLYTMFQANKLNAVYEEQHTRFEHIQKILSELYIEGFYLRKTLNDIESVTAKGHHLYRELKTSELPKEVSTLALTVAQELHEVKKDNQRILAGLEKVIQHEDRKQKISLSDIIDLSIKSNEKYGQFLQKEVQFSTNQQSNFNVAPVYPLLVIINNLVANAIEALSSEGHIKINTRIVDSHHIIEVIDNGVGIDEDEREVIFEPGYTTKFDDSGQASTGIGLSHVKSMVQELGGTIEVSSDEKGTAFTMLLPISVIEAKG